MDLNSCRDGTLFPCETPPPRLIIDATTVTHAAVLVLHHVLDKWSTFIKSIRIIRFGIGRPRHHSHVRGAKDVEKIARQRSCGGKLMFPGWNLIFNLELDDTSFWSERRRAMTKCSDENVACVDIIRSCRRRLPSSPSVGVRRRRRRARRRFVAATERFCSPHSATFLSPLLSTRVDSCCAAPRRATPRCNRTVWEDRRRPTMLDQHQHPALGHLASTRRAVHAWRTAISDIVHTRYTTRQTCACAT